MTQKLAKQDIEILKMLQKDASLSTAAIAERINISQSPCWRRIQRLVREGKLTNEEVSILYVSRSPGGSKVQRLRLDDEGDFMDDWPGGFFPERLREL